MINRARRRADRFASTLRLVRSDAHLRINAFDDGKPLPAHARQDRNRSQQFCRIVDEIQKRANTGDAKAGCNEHRQLINARVYPAGRGYHKQKRKDEQSHAVSDDVILQ
jgi:hypothetical protein